MLGGSVATVQILQLQVLREVTGSSPNSGSPVASSATPCPVEYREE